MTNTESYFTHNRETGKLELHFDRAFYMALTDDQKAEIKSAFYWFRASCCWVSRAKAPNLDQATKCAEMLGIKEADSTTGAAPARIAATVENAEGVHVGDLFREVWGWEQSNVDYYQVVALKGKHTAILREIYSERVPDLRTGGKCHPVPGKWRSEETFTVKTQHDGHRAFIYTKVIHSGAAYLSPTSADVWDRYTIYA